MDRGLKISLAVGVVVAGALTAWMFRLNAPSAELPPDTSAHVDAPQQTAERPARTAPRLKAPPAPSVEIRRRPNLETPRPPISILTPLDAGEPPPALARSYPYRGITTRRDGRIPVGPQTPTAADRAEQTRRHTIADGDTLEKLARRYLGDPRRGEEIYRANRDVLASPNLLPIGVELVIPPVVPQFAPEPPRPEFRPQMLPRKPLVPIFRRAE
jgi:nucleoid-associated protein YgaU